MKILEIQSKALYVAIAAALMAGSLASCSDDDTDATPTHTTDSDSSSTNISSVTIEANRFVNDVMSDYYYWNSEMPNLDYRKQSDTETYFYNLLSSKDRFSYISSDAQTTLDEFDGQYTDFGWDYLLAYLDSNSETVGAIINYVYPNSPAEAAGAKRGDCIYAVDGTEITATNYRTLFVSASTGTFKAKRVVDGTLTDVSYTMTAASITENPVACSRIIELSDGTKAGYLLYMSYSANFNTDLVDAFAALKEAGATEVILDLRYNPGGDSQALTTMCSILAPQDVVSAKSEMMYYEFNSTLSKYASYSRENTSVSFTDTLSVNMGLSRLVVLTGGDTYSAAEATIWSLKPYMDVTLIGSTTGGKNTMMYVMSPEDFTYSNSGLPYYSSSINNWLIMPIVAVYKNSNGEAFDTSDGTGLTPDYSVSDRNGLFTTGLKELGDPEENLLAAAISYLETGAVSTNKSITVEPTKITSTTENRPHLLYERKSICK